MSLCKKPFYRGAWSHGCGQCLLCRFNRRRVWTHRILLEASSHEENCFITLTYSDDYLPEGGTLVPRHVQLFIKRLRRAYPQPLRYFAVGEYGEESQRPHYHLVIFGADFQPDRGYYSTVLEEIWSAPTRRIEDRAGGCVHVGELTRDSAQYTCGYTVKSLTNNRNARVRLELAGRHPEFMRCSQGIGKGYVQFLADALHDRFGSELVQHGDVVSQLTTHGKVLPLGRYMKEKLREAVGLDDQVCSISRQIYAQAVSLAAQRAFVEREGCSRSQALSKVSQAQNQRVVNAEERIKLQRKYKRELD